MLFESPRHGWKDYSDAEVKRDVCEHVDWIYVPQDRGATPYFLSIVMNIRVT